MDLHKFILILEGIDEVDEGLEAQVYQAGCDDAFLGKRDGLVFLDFDRRAPSFDEAFSSAVEGLKAQGLEVFPEPGEVASHVGRKNKGKSCCRR